MISTSSSRVTPQRRAPPIWVRNCGAALPSVASAATVTICRVRKFEHGVLVDFSVDRLEHIGCELRSHVAERSFDLIRGLPEDLTDFLCAACAALRVRLHCGFLSPVALR